MQKIEPEELLEAYRKGRFPMAEHADAEEVKWHYPRRRGIIPMDSFHMSKRVKREMRKKEYSVLVDHNFRKVMESCADRDRTWINKTILDVYCALHEQDKAHSVEIYNKKDELVGGLYGISMGAAFFGESLFRYEQNMDKFALFHCHKILKKNGFELWDHQLYSEHLVQFGCERVWRWPFKRMLKKALKKECEFIL